MCSSSLVGSLNSIYDINIYRLSKITQDAEREKCKTTFSIYVSRESSFSRATLAISGGISTGLSLTKSVLFCIKKGLLRLKNESL